MNAHKKKELRAKTGDVTTGPVGKSPRSHINGDGVVNVRDINITCDNFMKE